MNKCLQLRQIKYKLLAKTQHLVKITTKNSLCCGFGLILAEINRKKEHLFVTFTQSSKKLPRFIPKSKKASGKSTKKNNYFSAKYEQMNENSWIKKYYI